MTDPFDLTPDSAQETAQEPPSRNGTNPLDLAQEMKLALRALEEVDMRLQSLQVACALITGLALLILVLQVKELRG